MDFRVARRHAGKLLVAGYSALHPPRYVLEALAAGSLGGVILFRRNIETVEQVQADLQNCLQAAGESIFLCVDQEGGRVERLKDPVIELPPARVMAQLGSEAIEKLSFLLNSQLAAIGFNTNFAPVADVDSNPQNPVIGDRAFSDDPREVVECAAAWIRGSDRADVLSCAKHAPGHGDTELDSHLDLPILGHSRQRLEQVEFFPFRKLFDAPSWMTAHIVVDAIDAKEPITLSPAGVTSLLREEFGFQGLLFSDDLEMKAVSERASAGELAVAAIEAGCDVLLLCSREDGYREALEAIAYRAERSQAFAERVLDALARRKKTLARYGEIKAYSPAVLDALRKEAGNILSPLGPNL